MSHPSSEIMTTSKSSLQSWLVKLLAGLGVLLLALYGLFAIDMGRVNISPALTDANKALMIREQTHQTAVQHNTVNNDAWKHSGLWLYGLSQATSPKYAYGNDSYYTYSFFHYTQMPKKNMVILAFHNVMGGICMLFGALQFWPAFRHKYPRWHRSFGAIYMLTAQLAMIGAAVYLSITPIKVIYDSFSFYVGLWVLVITVTLTLWMSIFHLIRREYAQHQAFMALNFGALLTAPMLRYDWFIGGWLFPDLSFNTANYWGAGILLPQCFVMGYLLLCISRSQQKNRPQSVTGLSVMPRQQTLLAKTSIAILTISVLTTIYYFVLSPDITNMWQAQQYIPAALIHLFQTVMTQQTGSRLLFTTGMLLVGIFGSLFIYHSFLSPKPQVAKQRKLVIGLLIGSLINGWILLHWGYQFGAPSTTTLSGGTQIGLYGVLTLLFSVLTIIALYRKNRPLWAELGVLTLLINTSMPVFFWLMHLLMLFPIPAEFITQGQVYRLAADAGPALVIAGFVYAVYSQATLGKFAR